MSDHYWLADTQLERIKPDFPRSHGRPRVDDRCVIGGFIHVMRNGLKWRDAPDVYGPYKTLYNRFIRWSGMIAAPIHSCRQSALQQGHFSDQTINPDPSDQREWS